MEAGATPLNNNNNNNNKLVELIGQFDSRMPLEKVKAILSFDVEGEMKEFP